MKILQLGTAKAFVAASAATRIALVCHACVRMKIFLPVYGDMAHHTDGKSLSRHQNQDIADLCRNLIGHMRQRLADDWAAPKVAGEPENYQNQHN